MDANSAFQEALKTALIKDGPAWGSCKTAKALGKCMCEPNCDEPVCVRLVEELCAEHGNRPN